MCCYQKVLGSDQETFSVALTLSLACSMIAIPLVYLILSFTIPRTGGSVMPLTLGKNVWINNDMNVLRNEW